MKKIEFYRKYGNLVDNTPEPHETEFPILVVVLYFLISIPVLMGFFVAFLLHVIQELIILLFTILKELIQLLKMLTNSLFKLGDTKWVSI